MSRRLAAWLLLSLALLAVACERERSAAKFHGVDVTGVPYAKDFALTDHNGKSRILADFRGKVVLLFFGFTHCPDVCPTAMTKFAQVNKLLGAEGDRLQVLFVTLDPARDTPALLAAYVNSFNSAFLGLYGDEQAIARTAQEFRIAYAKQAPDASGNYSVDHSAGSFAFDSQGRLRLFYGDAVGAAEIAADVRALLANPG